MPRNLAGPVVRGSDFYGRAADVAAMWRLLRGGSVLLAAPRRYGKSSLMVALHDQPQENWTVVLADVEYVKTPAELLTELTATVLQHQSTGRWFRARHNLAGRLAQWIRGVVEEVQIGFSQLGEAKLKLRAAALDPNDWRELAELLIGALGQIEGHVLVVLDEFPTMVDTMLDSNEDEAIRFLRWFRSLRHPPAPATVHFLLGGSVNIEPLLEELGQSSLINDLQRFQLAPLGPEVAQKLVEEVLISEGCPFDPNVPAAVVQTVGVGVPFFLQVLISELILERRKVSVADVQRAYQERVLGPTNRARFSHFGTRLRSYGADEQAARWMLAELAQGDRTTRQLHALVAAELVQPNKVLARLEGDYYLTRDGDSWHFQSQLLRDWWLRNVAIP
jgi:hypothetical protein